MEFSINKYLKLRLEKDKTIIYMGEKRFKQCRYLMLEIPLSEIMEDDYKSIDELAENYNNSLEGLNRQEKEIFNIPPEQEFWGHCSNLQAWYENNYDTRLIHSNIAFPLLKELVEVGDEKAKKFFKEEIAKKLQSGSRKVIYYLTLEKYTHYLNTEELETSLSSIHKKFLVWWKKIKANTLNTLNLNGCGLISIPDNIGDFKKLNKIELEVNNLRNFPETIGNLKELKFLNLSINNLKGLPINIGKLQNLNVLKAHSNYIEIIPDSFKNLRSLEKLNLSANKLKIIPNFIGDLKKLKSINLAMNDIKTLPNIFDDLTNLEKLELSYNNIEAIPESIGNLKKLKTLDLRDNQINYLPETINNLESIQFIYLSNNRIDKIPENLGKLKTLRILNLKGNNVKILPKWDKKKVVCL